MSADAPRPPTVVVSGLGGSGTRLPAVLCELLGVDMGRIVNSAHDDLLFTLMFKRPPWAGRAGLLAPAPAVRRQLAAYTRARCLAHPLVDRRVLAALAPGVLDQVRAGSERRTATRRAAWAVRQLAGLARSTAPGGAAGAWGLKEPTAHLYLDHIADRWPGVKYVHVVRDLTDYAVKPHNQVRLWASLLGVSVAGEQQTAPQNQLRYWAVANERALLVAKRRQLPTLVLRHEDTVADPGFAAGELARFLGLPLQPEALTAWQGMVERDRAAIGRGQPNARQLLKDLQPSERLIAQLFGYLTTGQDGEEGMASVVRRRQN